MPQIGGTPTSPAVGFLTGHPGGEANVSAWARFSDRRIADPLSLLLFADSVPPAVFEVLPERAWVPTIELTVQVRQVPVPGWLRMRMATRFLLNGYFDEDGEIWDSAGNLVAISRQFAMTFRP